MTLELATLRTMMEEVATIEELDPADVDGLYLMSYNEDDSDHTPTYYAFAEVPTEGNLVLILEKDPSHGTKQPESGCPKMNMINDPYIAFTDLINTETPELTLLFPGPKQPKYARLGYDATNDAFVGIFTMTDDPEVARGETLEHAWVALQASLENECEPDGN